MSRSRESDRLPPRIPHRPRFVLVKENGVHQTTRLHVGDCISVNREDGTTTLNRGPRQIILEVDRPDTSVPYSPCILRVSGREGSPVTAYPYEIIALIVAARGLCMDFLRHQDGVETYILM